MSIFRKRDLERLEFSIEINYNGTAIEIVNKFSYIRVTFAAGASSFEKERRYQTSL